MPKLWFGLTIAAAFPAALLACGLDDSVEVTGGSTDGGGADVTVSAQTDGSIGDSEVPSGDGAVGTNDGAPPPPKHLVYGNTLTDLYSLDVDTNVVTHVAALSGCGTGDPNDLAMNSAGELYIFGKSDGIYALALSGACTARTAIAGDDSIGGDGIRIAGRAGAGPSLIAIDPGHNNLYTLDPGDGGDIDINPNEFAPDSPYDITCAANGTCWTALDSSQCGGPPTGSCVFSLPSNGATAATSLGPIGVQPVGLAYSGNALYSFGADGKIAKIPLGVTPIAGILNVVSANATPLPPKWFGAGSSGANP